MTLLIHASACHLDEEVLFGVGRGVCKKREAWPKVLVKVLATHMETVLCFSVLVFVLFCLVFVFCFRDFGGFVAVLLLFLVGCGTKLMHKF